MNDKLNDFMFDHVSYEDMWEEAGTLSRQAVYDHIDKLGFALAGEVKYSKRFDYVIVIDHKKHKGLVEYIKYRHKIKDLNTGSYFPPPPGNSHLSTIHTSYFIPKDIFQLGCEFTSIFMDEMVFTFKKYRIDINEEKERIYVCK